MKNNIKGMVHLYYGDGKGKTTAAIGLGVRAALQSLDVYMIQFMKGSQKYIEIKIPKHIHNFKVKQCGRQEFTNKVNPEKIDIELAAAGLKYAKKTINSKKYDMIILDEINYALKYNLIKLDDVIELIENKPKNLELILTGNYAPRKLKNKADYVTELKKIKHPFKKGTKARKGIEY